MKGLFRFFGRLVMIAIIIGISGWMFFRHVSTLSSEANAYAAQTIPAVFSKWNAMELYDRASPEFKAVMTLDQVYGILRQASALGPLEKADAPRGGATVFYDFKKGKISYATVITRAYFERGDADLTLNLSKEADRWQIRGFNIQSPDLQKLGVSMPRALPSSPPPTASTPGSHLSPATVEEAQREVVRRYPEIGVAGSRLNQEFIARSKRYQKEHPDYLKDPSWPLRVAEEVAGTTGTH